MEGVENITTNEKINYRRLYGQFIREIIDRMKALNMEVRKESYDINEVLKYLSDENLRLQNQDDLNAIEAQIFYEWLRKNNFELPK